VAAVDNCYLQVGADDNGLKWVVPWVDGQLEILLALTEVEEVDNPFEVQEHAPQDQR